MSEVKRAGLGRAGLCLAGRGTALLGMARQSKARRGLPKLKLYQSKVSTSAVIRNVTLCGLKEIMFDRYAGDNDTKLAPDQKLYLDDEGQLVLPSLNVMSFMCAHNTNSAPKRLRDKRKYKDIANAMLSFTSINPTLIPFLRDGKPITFGRLNGDVDPVSGCYVHRAVARLDKGIPNPKERIVLPLPWALRFELTMYPQKEIKEQEIFNLFDEGGMAIGLGTFRGVFGKFAIEEWA